MAPGLSTNRESMSSLGLFVTGFMLARSFFKSLVLIQMLFQFRWLDLNLAPALLRVAVTATTATMPYFFCSINAKVNVITGGYIPDRQENKLVEKRNLKKKSNQFEFKFKSLQLFTRA